MADDNAEQDSPNLVAPDDACPTCGQRDMDDLVWIDDGERVQCQRCRTVYRPEGTRDGQA